MKPLKYSAMRNFIALRLKQNRVLAALSADAWAELADLLEIVDLPKGATIVTQGSSEMSQLFVIEGLLKRSVVTPFGKELILRIAAEDDMDTSYAAWKLGQRAPYSIVTLTPAKVARVAMPVWAEFIGRHPVFRERFEVEVLRVMADVMGHLISLHLNEASQRIRRTAKKTPGIVARISRKDLACYLNISPEHLSRTDVRMPRAPRGHREDEVAQAA